MNTSEDSKLTQGLYIIATPIGNIGDISQRATEVLRKVDILCCEDTRETGKLLGFLGLDVKKIPYHEHNAAEMRPKIVRMIGEGRVVGLVSDAGMPLISDPGYKLVQACHENNLYVTCIPGASASLMALVLSGLPPDRFMFAGFLPPKSGARRTEFSELKTVRATLVFYETANRLSAFLEDARAVLGNRAVAVAREMTKKFEEVTRGTIDELLSLYHEKGPPRGELVVVIGPPDRDVGTVMSDDALEAAIRDMLYAQNMSAKDVVAMLVDQTGMRKKDIYQKVLSIRERAP